MRGGVACALMVLVEEGVGEGMLFCSLCVTRECADLFCIEHCDGARPERFC